MAANTDQDEDILALHLDEFIEEKRVPPPPPATRDQRRGASIDFNIGNAFQLNDFQIDTENIAPPKLSKGKVDLWIDDGLDEDIVVNHEHRDNAGIFDNRESAFDSDAIPVIPDLEDAVVEDLMQQTAAAPSLNTFIDYKQLEEAILKHSAFAVFNGIELSVLIKRLVVTNFLEEEDVPWKWSTLISEVSSKTQIQPNPQENS
ncbi:intraflagellar transport protein 43-like protein [Leptotrombidium deliense]|uniref:Intraflagellar transport protein 43-like protein n=1 Tax=Leptotrombidium deliense TaxID=299467 RepID=A0A443SAY6_9ACAR|nr:intraflagellar transport protein 43-like protein [Leptotrombidium deliense]